MRDHLSDALNPERDPTSPVYERANAGRLTGWGAGTAAFWLKLGETAVTLGPGEEREVERIPEQLKRFL